MAGRRLDRVRRTGTIAAVTGVPANSGGGVGGDGHRARALAAVLVVTARFAAGYGAGGRLIAPAAGAALRAGEVVTVRWTPVDRGVEEFELLLSLDGGLTFPLRLTEMLDPGSTSYVWHVPNLPSGAARLRLRVGVEGRELLLPPGPEFTVAGDAAAPIERLTYRRGEWWPTEGVASEPHAVDVEPRWTEGGAGGEGAIAAAAISPPPPDLGAAQATTPAGRDGPRAGRARPASAVNGLSASISLPKRE